MTVLRHYLLFKLNGLFLYFWFKTFHSNLLRYHLNRANFFKNEILLWQIISPMRREKWFHQTKLVRINSEFLNEIQEIGSNDCAYQIVSSSFFPTNWESNLHWTIFRANLKYKHMPQNFERIINFEHISRLFSHY